MARSTDKRKGKPLPSERGVKRQTYGRLIPGDDIEVVREIERIWDAMTKADVIGSATYVTVGTVVEVTIPAIEAGLPPTGGSAGQVLKKQSGADYDFAWDTDNTGGGGGDGLWHGHWLGVLDETGVTDVTQQPFTTTYALDLVIPEYDANKALGYSLEMQFYGYLAEGQIIQMSPLLAGTPYQIFDSTGFESDYRTVMNNNPGWSDVDFGVQGGDLTISLTRANATASARDYAATTYRLRYRWIADSNDPWAEVVTGFDLATRAQVPHFKVPYQGASFAQTANYTATYIDDVIPCDTSGGSFTVSLPAITTPEWNGKRFLVKKITSDANTVTINPNASETIDGATTYVLRKEHESVILWNDFGEWKIESAYPKKAGLLMNWQGPTIPGSTGTAGGVWIVPQVDGQDVTFDITKTRFRCETAPATGPTTVDIESSAGGGAFSASTVDTLSLTTGVYEDTGTPGGTLTSGDVCRVNFTALGAGAAVYTVELEGKEQ